MLPSCKSLAANNTVWHKACCLVPLPQGVLLERAFAPFQKIGGNRIARADARFKMRYCCDERFECHILDCILLCMVIGALLYDLAVLIHGRDLGS